MRADVFEMASIMKKDMFLATCLGLGKIPWAPGTWASVPPVVTYQVLGYLGPEYNVYVMGFFIVAGVAMFLWSAPSARKSLAAQAQRQIVVDKFAGQGLTMFMIALLKPVEICNSMTVGFALFRLVDLTTDRFLKQRCFACTSSRILMITLASGAVAGILSVIAIHMLPIYFD